MKYYVRTLKEIRTVIEYEIEAESLQEARNIAYDLDEEDGNLVADDSDVLWESQIDLGPVEVYDDKRNIIYSNTRLDDE